LNLNLGCNFVGLGNWERSIASNKEIKKYSSQSENNNNSCNLFFDTVRILWLFVFLAFVSIGFTLISMYIVFVSKHPVLLITSAKKVKIQRILYPALTICAPNSFNVNKIREAGRYVSKRKLLKYFLVYFCS
jgi:hypothetical protein